MVSRKTLISPHARACRNSDTYLGRQDLQSIAVCVCTGSDCHGPRAGAYLSDCQIAKPIAAAEDAELAKRLWEVTERQLAEAEAKA